MVRALPVTLYVSKFPPSSSGIALYASVFEAVLGRGRRVRRLPAPASPRLSQSFASAVRGFAAGLGTNLSDVDDIHVELSGRALFEFYFCVGLTLRPSAPGFDVTCHDSPALVGPAALFRELDRKGLRRAGVGLSRLLGPPLERRVLRHAANVWTLSNAGARSLQRRYHARVTALPHVVDSPALPIKDRHVFVPGPIHNPDPLLDVIANLESTWPMVVGACSQPAERAIRAAVGERFPIEFTGFLDEAALLEEFAAAALVLRVRGKEETGNSLAASGPLCWAVSRGCVCVTDDVRAGAAELASKGLVIQTDDLAPALDAAIAGYREEDSQRVATEAEAALGVWTVASLRAALKRA